MDLAYILSKYTCIDLETVVSGYSLLERRELKYITTKQYMHTCLSKLSDICAILSIGGDTISTYDTVYFDTQDLGMYTQHRQGKSTRYKMRTRLYKQTDSCFFEIKEKSYGKTKKHRISYDTASHGLLNDNAYAQIQSIGCFDNNTNNPLLLPQLSTHYKRICLVDTYLGTRVTFDFDFVYTNMQSKKIREDTNTVIIEEKSNATESIMGQFVVPDLLQSIDKCSKYCMGMIYTHAVDQRNVFKPTLDSIKKLSEHTSKPNNLAMHTINYHYSDVIAQSVLIPSL